MNTPERSSYLDVVKLLLTVLVVGVHAAITYGATGSWFFHDPVQDFPTSVALSFFNIYCQSFFMGLFFFLSGLFTPRSIERKGTARFVLDRVVRLGIPLAVFFFVINPLTEYAGYRAAHPAGLGLLPYLRVGLFRLGGTGTGPLWFVQALLGFSILAAIAAVLFPAIGQGAPRTDDAAGGAATPRPARTILGLLGIGLAVGVASFVARQWFPLMTSVSNLQLGFFPQYIVWFALGIAAGRRGTLERLMTMSPRPWYWLSLPCALLLPAVMVAGGALENGLDAFTTGLTWQALAYALWEQVSAVVFSMAILSFARRHLGSPGPLVRVASRNAFVTYVFHAPAIVWIAYAGLALHLPPAVKWVLLVVAGCAATVLLGELVLKRIPGVRRVMY
jgi:glucans biosynthesis protein C